MNADPPVTEYRQVEGSIELAWGHPDPVLLPVDDMRAAAARALDVYGDDALAYGNPPGPGPAMRWVCERLAAIDLHPPSVDRIVMTGGNSQALDMVTTLCASTGDVMLVESPTYHLAFRIFRDHGLAIEPVTVDEQGMRVDELAETVARLRRAGRTVRLVYTIPTFHNPTGISYSAERRRALVDLAEAEGLTIVEDDPYRELAYDGSPPPSLWSIAKPGAVIRLGTFSKSLAPGLRVGFLTADPSTAGRIGMCGLLDSGGGISHFPALMLAEYGRSGAYETNLDRLRTAYRERRDAMLGALAEHLSGHATWNAPAGGYFLWLTLAGGLRAVDLLPVAEAHGTAFVPGPVFHADRTSGASSLRLAFSRHSPAEIAEAVRRLGAAVRGTR